MPKSLDIQARLIEILNTDPDMGGIFGGNILYDDPNGIKVGQQPLIAVALAEDDFVAATLGGSGAGTHTITVTFGIHVYTSLGPTDASPASNDPTIIQSAKQSLVVVTDTVREVLWKYRTNGYTSDGTTLLWRNMAFRRPATKYLGTQNYRKSSTYIDISYWVRNR